MVVMSPHSILIFNWRDIKNPEAGGAEVFTHEIAKRLVRSRHKVTLFTSRFPGARRKEIVDGVEIIRKGNRLTVYYQAYIYYKKDLKGKFDVVVDEINGNLPWFTPVYIKEKKVAIRHQVEFSGIANLRDSVLYYELPLPLSVFLYLFEYFYLTLYRLMRIPMITVSDSTRKDLLALGFTERDISIVPDAISFRPLKVVPKKEACPTLIYVGRLAKSKGIEHAIGAHRLVRKKFRDAKLWVVGDGYMRKRLERRRNDQIIFFGRVSEAKKQQLMRKAHLLLVPSVREGWGIVVIEANACGTPAVGYNVPGLRDSIKNGRTGFLVKQQNIEALADAIIEILKNGELREKLSKGALEWSRKFSWDRSAEGFTKTLERIISE